MELFIIRDFEPLSKSELLQATESVQLAVSLWSQQHERTVIAELTKAIMLDEPLKMYRLADLFNIDIASVHTMWVFSGFEFTSENVDAAAECAARFCNTSFADIYQGFLVLFMDGPETSADANVLGESINEILPVGVTTTIFTNMENTTDVRQSFLANKEYLADAKKILPNHQHITGGEISFARECRNKIASGDEAVTAALAPLNVLHRKRGSEELERTLSVFLLDSELSVQFTAERLFLHKNTVKYRLKCLSDCFGFPVGQMPASYGLFEAVAIKRLLRTE